MGHILFISLPLFFFGFVFHPLQFHLLIFHVSLFAIVPYLSLIFFPYFISSRSISFLHSLPKYYISFRLLYFQFFLSRLILFYYVFHFSFCFFRLFFLIHHICFLLLPLFLKSVSLIRLYIRMSLIFFSFSDLLFFHFDLELCRLFVSVSFWHPTLCSFPITLFSNKRIKSKEKESLPFSISDNSPFLPFIIAPASNTAQSKNEI